MRAVTTQPPVMPVPRRLTRPDEPHAIRLEIDPAAWEAVEDAAHHCRLSVASFCRLWVEMGAKKGAVTLAEVKTEADKRLSKGKPGRPGRGT